MALDAEPVMRVVIFVPQRFAAGAEACVSDHRGLVDSSEHRDGLQTIRARVPHADVAVFVSALLADTDGAARTSMMLSEYWPVLQSPPGDPTTGVREPRPKIPAGRSGAIAVPEPDDWSR